MKALIIQIVIALSLLGLFNNFVKSDEPVKEYDMSSYNVEWCLSESRTKYPCEYNN